MLSNPLKLAKSLPFAISAVVGLTTAASAMPQARPEALARIRQEGRFDQFVELMQNHAAVHEWAPSPLRPNGPGAATADSIYSLVFLVEFPDQAADQTEHSPGHFEEMLFSKDQFPTGSVRDYYTENSYGQFAFAGGVTAVWYMAPHNLAGYYCNADGIPGTPDDYGMGGGAQSVAGLIQDMVNLTDDEIDFSLYDADHDGTVESFFLIHAGPGAEATGDPNDIWSHRSSVNILTNDGVRLRDYTTEPEDGKVGVFAHEFGHVLGLPDLYDTDYSSAGVGNWSIMASGSWTGGGVLPVHFDAWSKVDLGWVDPVVIELKDVMQNPFSIPRVEDHPVIYKLPVVQAPQWEYFLVENRQKVLNDGELPGDGLLIWHCDDARFDNRREGKDPLNLSPHYLVTVEEADCYENSWVYWESDGVPGSFELEQSSGASGDSGDPFPGRYENRNFHASTWPNSHAYNGNDADSHCAVLEISDSADTMTAIFDVARVLPVLEVVGNHTEDTIGGDGDGRGESGEAIELVLDLSSVWGDAPGVTAVLSTDDPRVSITDPNGSFGDLAGGSQGDNAADPFGLTIGTIEGAQVVDFELEITSQPMGQAYVSHASFQMVLGWPDVLLVDDDGGADREAAFRTALAAGGMAVIDEWSVAEQSGTVQNPFTTGNRTIVWVTGEESSATLTAEDQAALEPLLAAGTNFVLSGENWAEDAAAADFYFHTLHLQVDNPATGDPVVSGVAENEVFGVFAEKPLVILQASPSSLTPLDEASAAIAYAPSTGTAAITYNGMPSATTHKVVAFGFDLGMGQDPEVVWQYLISAVEWMPRGVEGGRPVVPAPTRLVLEPNAPNPFNPRTTITFEVPAETHAALRIYDLRGGLVRTLLDRELMAGRHSVQWNGTSDAGLSLASGVYLYRLETKEETLTRRMLLLK